MRRTAITSVDSLPKGKAEFIEPMECALVSALPEGSDWTYEVKLDGYRAIGVRTSRDSILYSRNHKNFNKRFPQIAGALGDLEMFWFRVRSVSPEPALTRSNFGYAFTRT
jgi:ATP-dependent DNA ligase